MGSSILQARKIPDKAGTIVGFFRKGRILKEYDRTKKQDEIHGKKSNWVKVKTDTGIYGWAFAFNLKPISSNPFALYKKAKGFEKTDPKKSIENYKIIIEKYPTVPLDEMTYFGSEAKNRINIINCMLSRSYRKFEHRNELGKAIVKAVKSGKKSEIIQLASCDFNVGYCNSDNVKNVQFEEFIFKFQRVKSLANWKSYQYENVARNQVFLYMAQKYSHNHKFGFWLWKVYERWEWSGFCFSDDRFFFK